MEWWVENIFSFSVFGYSKISSHEINRCYPKDFCRYQNINKSYVSGTIVTTRTVNTGTLKMKYNCSYLYYKPFLAFLCHVCLSNSVLIKGTSRLYGNYFVHCNYFMAHQPSASDRIPPWDLSVERVPSPLDMPEIIVSYSYMFRVCLAIS